MRVPHGSQEQRLGEGMWPRRGSWSARRQGTALFLTLPASGRPCAAQDRSKCLAGAPQFELRGFWAGAQRIRCLPGDPLGQVVDKPFPKAAATSVPQFLNL